MKTAMTDAGSDFENDIYPSKQILDHLAIAGQWSRLLVLSRERLAQRVDDRAGHRGAAVALIYLKFPDEADIHVKILLQQDPEFYFHHELAAFVAMQKMDFKLARVHLEKGLASQPEMSKLHRLLSVVLSALGENDLAEHHMNLAQELGGDIPESWMTREAVLAANTNRTEVLSERIHSLEKALALDPTKASLIWRVGSLLLEFEYLDSAEVWLKRAVAEEPLNRFYKETWVKALERRNLMYRCLSFAWRVWRNIRRIKKVTTLRPDLYWRFIRTLPIWVIFFFWWLASLLLLAPIGVVVRYFMMPHPIFDFRWVSRRWLYGCSAVSRAFFMCLTLMGIALLLFATVPIPYLQTWGLLTIGLAAIQLSITFSKIQKTRSAVSGLPEAWLRPMT